MMHLRSARGFTLVETLIATGLLITAMAGLAQLLALSVRFTRESAQFGVALVGAQDKLESLRALPFGYGADGEPATDPRLTPSPAIALVEDLDGSVDWLDASGGVTAARDVAEYVRRWRVMAIATDDPEAIVIDVCVFNVRSNTHDVNTAEACLATARVRQP